MALLARYLMLTQPEELTSGQWSTIQSYLAGSSGLGRFALASTQPNERLHRAVNGTSYVYEGLMEETDLSAAGLAALYSAALGGTPDEATIEGYLGDGTGAPHFEVPALAESWDASRSATRSRIATLGYICLGPNNGTRQKFWIGPAGSSAGAGTRDDPWDLDFILDGITAGLLPKALIYARGGSGGSYAWALDSIKRFTANGYIDQPVEIRGDFWDLLENNWPVLSGTFEIPGAYVQLRDLVKTSEPHERYTEWPGSTGGPTQHGYNWPLDTLRKFGLGVGIINCILHDHGSNGLFDSGESVGGPGTYGNCIICPGWDSPDGEMWDENGVRTGQYAHGWGIYSQANGGALKQIRRNIISSGFAGVWEAQGTGASANKNQLLEGNLLYGSGLLGWTDEVRDVTFRGNAILAPGSKFRLGTVSSQPRVFNLTIDGGILYRSTLEINRWESGTVTGVRCIDPENATSPLTGEWSEAMVENVSVDNLEIQNSKAAPFNRVGVRTYTLQESRDLLGWNANSTQAAGPTTGHEQFIFPNEYADPDDPDLRLAIVLSLNHDKALVHTLDLSSLPLTAGKDYRLRCGFNPLGNPLVVFTSDGSNTAVAVDTTAWVMPTPTGTYKGAPVPGPIETDPPWANGVAIFLLEYAHDPNAAEATPTQLALPGTTGNYVSTPAIVPTTQSWTLRIEAALTDWSSNSNQYLLGQSRLSLSVDGLGKVQGIIGSTAVQPGVVAPWNHAGARVWIEMAYTHGATGSAAFRYSADYDPDTGTGTWAALGGPIAITFDYLANAPTGTANLFATSSAAALAAGTGYRLQFFNASGTRERDVDFTSQTVGATSFPDSVSGATVTIQQNDGGVGNPVARIEAQP